MRPRSPLAVLLLVAALAMGLVAAGCGDDEEEFEVAEGERLEFGELVYNISISRYLNPNDPEDRAYLQGQGQLPEGKLWYAVFMQIENEGDEPVTIPEELPVTDTQGREYHPVPSRSLFALDVGGQIPADGEVPEAETTAASGPIQGAMLLYQIDLTATEKRPLTLEIPGPDGEHGEVELDI